MAASIGDTTLVNRVTAYNQIGEQGNKPAYTTIRKRECARFYRLFLTYYIVASWWSELHADLTAEPLSMRVIIVGAGIAGLSLAIALGQSGHQITILDAAAQLAELGAGVQMTPQAIRYLFKWGLKDDLLSESIIPEDLYVRDGHSGDLLGTVRIKDMEAQYGAPYIVVHRAVLHAILHRHAIRAGAQLLLESDVVEYEFANGAVQLRNGNRLAADLVVAADGAYCVDVEATPQRSGTRNANRRAFQASILSLDPSF